MNEVLSRTSIARRTISTGRIKVMSVFGTRPDLIKFLPVLRELHRRDDIEAVNVLTSQHTHLIAPLLRLWDIAVDHDLQAMRQGQSLNELMARVQSRMDPVLQAETPDILLVQGDTTSALAAALAAWHRRVPVGHIEAGLRSGTRETPFPEEANRRLVTALATLHFAPTRRNAEALRAEGVPDEGIIETGNPIVDAVTLIRETQAPSRKTREMLDRLDGQRVIVMTTHRRESFGAVMRDRMRVLRRFVEAHDEISVVFPVHANPAVREVAAEELGGLPRVHLIDPLDYPDFLHCLSKAWLIVSDSGGVQEEAPTLGKPLLIMRAVTERPEAVECGVARMVGEDADALLAAFEEAREPDSWATQVRAVANPFGQGDSARRIVDAICAWRGAATSAKRLEAAE
jgi:UDP-N-acetylglucosamine 2-epimerase (non-hydrolysing)